MKFLKLEQSEEAIEISEEETAVRTEMFTSESLTAEDDNHELHIMWANDEGIFFQLTNNNLVNII